MDTRLHADEMLALAERFFCAIEAGDLTAIRAIYAPGARIWHNFDRVDQDLEQNLETLKWLVGSVRGLSYTEVRRQATASGFVQQHVLCGRSAAGVQFEIPACIVARVENGRIARIEEYLDPAQAAALR